MTAKPNVKREKCHANSQISNYFARVSLLKTVFFVSLNEKKSKSAVSAALRITHIHDGHNMVKCTNQGRRSYNILTLKKDQDWEVKCKLSGAGGVRAPSNSLKCDS